MVIDRYVGNLAAYRRDDGSVRLVLTNPGPLRVSHELMEQADPEFVSRAEDLVTFHGTADDGSRQSYRYRVVGQDETWLFCEPAPW